MTRKTPNFTAKFNALLDGTLKIGIRYSGANYMVNACASVSDDDGYQANKLEKEHQGRLLKLQLTRIEKFKMLVEKHPDTDAFNAQDKKKMTELFLAVAEIRAKRKASDTAYALNTLKEVVAPENTNWVTFRR